MQSCWASKHILPKLSFIHFNISMLNAKSATALWLTGRGAQKREHDHDLSLRPLLRRLVASTSTNLTAWIMSKNEWRHGQGMHMQFCFTTLGICIGGCVQTCLLVHTVSVQILGWWPNLRLMDPCGSGNPSVGFYPVFCIFNTASC